MKFDTLNLKPKVLKGLKDIGYEELTPVQEHTFPHILAGRDMIAKAETGSGKTAACGVPLVQAVDESLNAIQSLIVVPTRELALQYVSEISSIAKHTNIAPFAVYGGFSMDIQKSKLNHGVHILVATPGRLIDLVSHSDLSLSEVRTFVLDEADEMLNMGFITDIEFIMSCLVHDHQTLLFSATMPKAIQKLAQKYLNDPVTIELNIENVAPQNLTHQFKRVSKSNHFDSFVNYLKEHDPEQAIIFCNSRRNVEILQKHLQDKKISAETIHGGMEQSKRTSLFNRFKKKQIKLMIATDIASRGLDFSGVSHVINYDFPKGQEAYTHRTGRTARMGRKGTAITFYSNANLRDLKNLIKANRIEPQWLGEAPDLENIKGGRRSSGGKKPHQKWQKKRTKSAQKSAKTNKNHKKNEKSS